MTERKGLHILLEALSLVINTYKDLTLLIAGHRNQKYFEKLVIIVQKLRLENNVKFLPLLSEIEKSTLMRNCKIFIVPSIKDYTPVTLIEAQALGKPVISTNTGAIPEIVKNNETGLLVKPEDPESLALAIKRLLFNEEERLVMGNKAKDWISQNFSLSDVVNKLEKLYFDCI